MVLFAGLHLAMLGTISWRDLGDKSDDYLAPAFMEAVAGPNAARVVTALLVWTCLGSAFAGLLSYSRIPYGAARYGHFFALFRRVHPEHRIPHVSLLLVGGLVLPWCFFDLQNVINALIITRIVEQFVAQIGAVVLLRQSRPLDERPFRLWCYPIPCGLALIGWLYLYVTSDPVYIGLGAGTLFVGVGVFLVWSRRRGTWPFDRVKERPESLA
jgi:amino acid transporter